MTLSFKHLLASLSLLAFTAASAPAATNTEVERVEVTFVLDTTGSMGDLIEGAKRKIWSIASTIVDQNPDADIAMALVAYRDRGDDYVVKTTPLSEDVQGLYGKLIKLQADGGNDTPESVNEALAKAVTSMQWSKGDNVKRIVFLVGDAPPHMDYDNDRPYTDVLKEAKQRGIIVNAVQAGDDPETTGIWKDIAQRGNGRFIPIPQDGGEITVSVTPYDDEILELQIQIDRTVVPYGNREQQLEFNDKMNQKAEAPSSTRLENSKYYAKRKSVKEVVTGGGDLVADVRNKTVNLDGVLDAELPEELRNIDKAKRNAWIEERLQKRTALEEKMEALVEKRDAHILAERSKTAENTKLDSFDRAVEDVLKSQLN
jgi:Mg-chelatase subunit ChlD